MVVMGDCACVHVQAYVLLLVRGPLELLLNIHLVEEVEIKVITYVLKHLLVLFSQQWGEA